MVATDDLEIRRARPGDATAVHRTLRAAFEPLRDRYTPDAFDATVLDPGRALARLAEGPVWVAVLRGQVVGTFGIRHDALGSYLRGMGVLPEARGRGVGRRLLNAATAFTDSAAPSRTWLYTTPFLTAAIRLYQSAGFVRFEEEPAPDLFGTPLIGMHLPPPG